MKENENEVKRSLKSEVSSLKYLRLVKCSLVILNADAGLIGAAAIATPRLTQNARECAVRLRMCSRLR